MAECGGVWVIGAIETEGKGKGQGRMLYGDPYGFEELIEEDEDEKEEDKPPTMVDSSEDELAESPEEEESEESEGEEDTTLNFFEAFLTETGGVFPVPEKYKEDLHCCKEKDGCCGGFQEVRRTGKNRRKKVYRKIETPGEWHEKWRNQEVWIQPVEGEAEKKGQTEQMGLAVQVADVKKPLWL